MTTTENGSEPLLRLKGVSKNFGPVQALSDVDLEIPAGKVTALIGDNGAGKSVMIKCIAGIHAPDHGQIFWEGKPVRIRTPREAAALGIETVYQDLALCNNLDIVQNMFLGRERMNDASFLDEEAMEKAAGETLASLAVTTVRSIRQPVASLSGGQRQSVAIAKAVLWDAKLVIMDEPTAALGVAQTRMVLDLDAAAGRAGPRGAVRVPQHERRLRGRRPDHRALPRPRRRAASGGGARPADRGRPDDDRAVGAARARTETAPDGRRSTRPSDRPSRTSRRPSRRLARPSSRFRPRSPPESRRRILALLARADQGRRERRPAGHRGADPDLDPLRVPRLEVPDRRQPRQPARPGRGLQPARDGRGLRPAARRDRPLGRVRRRPRRRDHGRPREPGSRLAVVGGDRRRAARLRRDRAPPGHDHHADRPAVVRRHARRPPLLAGRAPEDPRQRRDDPDPGRHDQQHRERQHQPARRLDRDARARRGASA